MSYLDRFLAKQGGVNFSFPQETNRQNRQNPVSSVSSVSIPAPVLSIVIPQAKPDPLVALEDPPVALAAVEPPTAKPSPATELDRLVEFYRAVFRRLDTPEQQAGDHRRLFDLLDRIRRLSPGFDLVTLCLEEGAAPMMEPVPPSQDPQVGACYVCGGLERWKAAGDRQPWKCGRCHPPANPEAVEWERVESDSIPQEWDEETAWLIGWLAIAPIPSDPFRLRSGSAVSDPARFVAGLLADAEHGPGGPRARTGALQAALMDLWRLVNGEAAGARPGSEE